MSTQSAIAATAAVGVHFQNIYLRCTNKSASWRLEKNPGEICSYKSRILNTPET